MTITAFARKFHLTTMGWFTLEVSRDKLTALQIGKKGTEFGSSPVIDPAITQLDEYFAGQRQVFSIPYVAKGTPFQERVWAALGRIPYAAFPSYSDIAEMIGRPTASRAVGMANHQNPIAIIIPCHRVIGKGGQLTGYAGGLELKRALIDLELSAATSVANRAEIAPQWSMPDEAPTQWPI